MRKSRLAALVVLALALVAAGCVNLGMFDDSPITIRVHIKDGEGVSVPNAFVQLIGSTSYATESDADGVATFQNVTPREIYAITVNAQIVDTYEHAWGGTDHDVTVTYIAKPNLLQNPGFEDLTGDGNPQHWNSTTYGGSATFKVVAGEGRGGSNALMIHSDSGADASMGQTVELEGNTTYRLSGWIKTVDFNPNTGFGAQLSVHELGQGAIQPVVTDRNSDWVFVTKTFRTNEAGNYNILALFGGWGQSIGTAYWDDVSLFVE